MEGFATTNYFLNIYSLVELNSVKARKRSSFRPQTGDFAPYTALL